MPRTPQVFAAITCLSRLLTASGISHGFHGGFLTVALGHTRDTEEVFCIVQSGFRQVRQAVAESEEIKANLITWCNKLFCKYNETIPPIEIEILIAGEEGPRTLDGTTVMGIKGLPFLAVSEFLRAKLRVWMIKMRPEDAQDIIFMMTRYWANVDINRIPEADMARFVEANPTAAPAWDAVRSRYPE